MRRVAVTGLGVTCGGASSVGGFWEMLLSGASAVRRLPALAGTGLDVGPMAVAAVAATAGAEDDGAELFQGTDRATPLALQAAGEAAAAAALPPLRPEQLGVALGTTLGGKGRWLAAVRDALGGTSGPERGDWSYAAPAHAVAARHRAGQVRVVSTACASGNAALGAGLDLIRQGRCDVVLAGGVDALQDFVIAGFGALKAHAPGPCKPFDRLRRGLNLGEGAGFLVLESEAHARARGQRVLAYLDGCGLSCDANHMTGPDRDGRGAARAMQAALREAALAPERVDFVSLHGTATRFNDLMEAHALRHALGARAEEVPVNSIKGAVGHTLGAAGLLEAIMAVRALEEQRVPPTCGLEELDPEIRLAVVSGRALPLAMEAVLSTSSGFGGLNAAIVLRRGDS